MRTSKSSHKRISASQIPDITVYLNRRKTVLWLIFSVIGTLLFFSLLFFMLIAVIVIPAHRGGGAIFLALFFSTGVIAGVWSIRVLVGLLLSGKPTLVVNHKGICVGKLYGSARLFLPWEEINAIYIFRDMLQNQLFCIRPIHSKMFLPGLSPMMRFFLRGSFMNGAPISISQTFLEKPIEEIFDQLRIRYIHELDHHHIQLKP